MLLIHLKLDYPFAQFLRQIRKDTFKELNFYLTEGTNL